MKTLQECMQNRDIHTILGHHSSMTMWFMTDKVSEKELMEDREICVKEIEKRLSDTVTKE